QPFISSSVLAALMTFGGIGLVSMISLPALEPFGMKAKNIFFPLGSFRPLTRLIFAWRVLSISMVISPQDGSERELASRKATAGPSGALPAPPPAPAGTASGCQPRSQIQDSAGPTERSPADRGLSLCRETVPGSIAEESRFARVNASRALPEVLRLSVLLPW